MEFLFAEKIAIILKSYLFQKILMSDFLECTRKWVSDDPTHSSQMDAGFVLPNVHVYCFLWIENIEIKAKKEAAGKKRMDNRHSIGKNDRGSTISGFCYLKTHQDKFLTR